MKKNGFWIAILSMACVLAVSFVCTQYIIPFFKTHYTYSETECLTNNITDDMDAYQIRDLYSQGGAVTRVVIYSGSTAVSHGSGVCIASNGYKTTSLSTEYTASKGSYFATNYHVIEDTISSSYTIEVEMEHKDENGDLSYPSYPSKLLWYNKDLDVAIIYTEYNFGYVSMYDGWVDYDETGRHTQSVFVIGTPLDTMHRNRVTLGGVASITGIYANTETTVNGSSVVDNYYEDVIDLNVDISPGNSGGGVFDKSGRVIALASLSMQYEDGGENSLNGATSIYPIMKAIDKVIVNNETDENNKIYDIEKAGLKGYDANEAYAMRNYHTSRGYYLDGTYYSSVSFSSDGFYVYSSTWGLSNGSVIKSITLTQSGQSKTYKIEDRNDLLYTLLRANTGDTLDISYKTSLGLSATKTVSL